MNLTIPISLQQCEDKMVQARNLLSEVFHSQKNTQWHNVGKDKKSWFSHLIYSMGELDVAIQKIGWEVENDNASKP